VYETVGSVVPTRYDFLTGARIHTPIEVLCRTAILIPSTASDVRV
jgi:hypothetical protein